MSLKPDHDFTMNQTISSTPNTASSNLSGSNDFVKKLFQMLQEDGYIDVVRWTFTGDSFVVLNTNEFTKDILPRHFKHSNFASFVRQLNKYDFHKVKIPNEEKHNYPYGEDAWEFKHPDFRMNDRESLENIKRKGPSNKKISSSSGIGEISTAPSSGGSYNNVTQLNSIQNLMKEDIDQLRADNKSMHHEINILKTKYKTLIENIVSINNVNERYHRSMGVLVNCLVQAGIKLPPLDFPNPNLLSLHQPNNLHSNVSVSVGIPGIPHPIQQTMSQPTISPQQSMTQQQARTPQQPISAPLVAPLLASPGGPRMPIHPQSAGGTSASNYISQQSIQPQLTGRGTPPSNENLTPKPHTPLENSSGGSPALVSASSTAVPLPQVSTTTLANPKFHVLLVEDDNVCIQLCRKFLVKYGCQVTVATDGLNAISTVEHTKYDLVLMDIVMPNLDGATATSVIRSFDTKTPIIAMTGNIEDNDLVTYLQNGMSDILAKPFTKDDLYSILSKHLLTDETKGSAPRTNGLTLHRRNTSPVTTTDTAETPDGLQSGLTNLQRASQTIVSPTLPTSEDPVLKKQRLQR